MQLIRSSFIARMRRELTANRRRKGPWSKWRPDRLLLISEVVYHVGKLVRALQEGDRAGVSEYAADVANYAMKADQMYGEGSKR